MATTLMLGATLLLCLGSVLAGDLRHTRGADWFTIGWVASIAAWPLIVIYVLAPLLWGDPAGAGPFFAVAQYLPAVGFSAASTMRAARSGNPQVHLPAALLATLFPLALVFQATGGGQLTNTVMAMAIFGGTIVRAPKAVTVETLALASRLSMVLLVGTTTVFALTQPGTILGDCRADKCGFAGEALNSAFAGNGNLIGLATAVLVPFALHKVPLPSFGLILAATVLVAEVSVSRTAYGGIAVAVAATLAISYGPGRWFRGVIAACALTVALVLSLFPLYASYNPTDYSLRGYLWDRAKELVAESPLVGHGPNFWESLGKNALFDANYSPHNGWLDIAVALGAVGVATVVAAAVVHVRSTAPTARIVLVLYFSTILAITSFESLYIPYYLGIAPFAAILPLVLYSPASTMGNMAAPPHQKTPTGSHPLSRQH